MSALKQHHSIIDNAQVAAQARDWQVDRARNSARHVSGLTVAWQVERQGAVSAPSLDIGGLSKLKASAWAERLEALIEEAIILLCA